MRYYLVTDDEIARKIDLSWRDWLRVVSDAEKLCHEIAADSFCFADSVGRVFVSGFKFPADKSMDSKQWIRMKDMDGNAWRPQANTKLAKQISKLSSNLLNDVAALIGMETLKSDENGLRIRSPGVAKRQGKFYLTIPDDVEPKGCQRVSDIDYEQATKTSKPKQKKRKK